MEARMAQETQTVHLVLSDGWMAVYLGERKVHEDHDIGAARLLELLDIDYDVTEAQDQADAGGGFPATYAEVRPDVL